MASGPPGAGAAAVARVEVTGVERVARTSTFVRKSVPGGEFRPADVNGLPALLVVKDGTVAAPVCATAGPDGIDGLYRILTPEKLRAHERSARRAR
ncbi:hypothetical protein [Streptomyces sp. enrichment culture]|uniref:hypothetical protein n=1 Tax=Streptomyces sp. enrichment culture TaxID=1795815 RepID=UPI003F56DA10